MKAKFFLIFSLVLATARAGFPYAEATVEQLQAQMQSGTLTSVRLTQAYLARIAAVDQSGPQLHAVIEVNPDALAIAAALDAERKAGHVRGPLHGIPVLLKDNIATRDRMETTAGSLALVGTRPPRDATLVAALRKAGAVILGKTNLSEWANFRGEKAVSGWSARGGQARNPYALERNPSGSSSGSAAGVAANLCAIAVGSETDGSIVSPASVCGIVGVKPTVGLVSRAGIIPISISQDTAGPLARTVRDAALLLEAMSAADPADPATQARPAGMATRFSAQLVPGALHGARIGVVRGNFGLAPMLEPLLDRALAAMKAAGAEVVDLGEFPGFDRAGAPELDVLFYEFKDGMNADLRSLGPDARMKSLSDLIAFNAAHADQELSFFGQELFVKAQAKGPLTDQAYLAARATCLLATRAEGIDALMRDHKLDALVSLTNGPAWLTDSINGDSYTGGSSSPAAVAGYPSVSVPAGEFRGLPVGISFYGQAWTETKLLSLAADFEKHTHARREPVLP